MASAQPYRGASKLLNRRYPGSKTTNAMREQETFNSFGGGRDVARRATLSRLVLILSVLFFAVAGLIPDSAASFVGPQSQIAGDSFAIIGSGEGDGDPDAASVFTRAPIVAQFIAPPVGATFEQNHFASRSVRGWPFEARGPPLQ